MSVSVPTQVLLGRAREQELVDGLLAAARRGQGTTLMFAGEPGSGKTALLAVARSLAADFTVVSCRGVQWEAELPFSGLHELVQPLLGDLPALPDPQRRAVEGALGLAPAAELHTLHLYAGVLSLLTEASRERPVLVVVDDLQWVDSPTSQVLSFVARRLAGESVVMLVASRPGTLLQGSASPPVQLTPLDRSAVAALAGRRLGRELPDAAIDDLAAASAGNPLAVVESVAHFGGDLWLRGSVLDEPLPVGALIERGFSDRVAELSPDARAAVELAAAAVTEGATMVGAAIAHLGLPSEALLEAERAGVVAIEGARVQFVHPLLRALVHRQTDRATLRRCHAALAAASGDEVDLRAWHAASATTDPDEVIATDLDEAAERFVVRGGHLAAAQALSRSAELTPCAEVRADRLLRAGLAARLAGRAAWAVTLFDAAGSSSASSAFQRRAAYETACMASHLEPTGDLVESVMGFYEDARGADNDLAADAAGTVANEATLSGRADLALQAIAMMRELREAEDLSPSSRQVLDATLGVVTILMGSEETPDEGGALVRRACEQWLQQDVPGHAYIVEALVWIEEYELAERIVARMIAHAQARGNVFILSEGLMVDGYRRLRIGDWKGAAEQLAESTRLSMANDLVFQASVVAATFAVIRAAQGDADALEPLAQIEVMAREHGFDIIEEYTGSARGLYELGRGHGAEAAVHLERVRAWKEAAGQAEPCVFSWAADLVDAHALAGDVEQARAALERLRARSLVTARPWALASVARLDGLLASEADYPAHFERALALFDRTAAPFDRARAQLAYGQRLRRSRRRADARVPLESALGTFETLGAEPWAAQARRELRATGASLRSGADAASDELTAQEREIAELVAGGASNKEAAGTMFLSPKTIETHLSRVYRKLGVSSRTQLAVRLREEA